MSISNIIKEFNPRVLGASIGKKSFIHFATKVKFAEMSPYIRLIQTMCSKL